MNQGVRATGHGPRVSSYGKFAISVDLWLEFEKKFFFCGNRRNRRNAVISE